MLSPSTGVIGIQYFHSYFKQRLIGYILSLDVGLKQFDAQDAEERLIRYRRHVHEVGALD